MFIVEDPAKFSNVNVMPVDVRNNNYYPKICLYISELKKISGNVQIIRFLLLWY